MLRLSANNRHGFGSPLVQAHKPRRLSAFLRLRGACGKGVKAFAGSCTRSTNPHAPPLHPVGKLKLLQE
jgi:hypothetical protein